MNEIDPTAPPTAPQAESAEAARERRLRALRALASQQLAASGLDGLSAVGGQYGRRPSGRPASVESTATPATLGRAAGAHGSRRRGRVWVVAVGVVALCVAVVAVGAFSGRLAALPFLRQAAAPLPPITSRVITPLTDGVTCFTDASWAPKGELLALLGYQRDCPNLFNFGSLTTGIVTIYRGVTGKPQSQVMLDHLLTAQPGFPATTQVIHYHNLLWSPDGQRLAITFDAETSTFVNASFGFLILATGVLVMNLDGSNPHATIIPTLNTNPTASHDSLEIETTTGRLLTPTALPPTAVAYRWGAQGQLLPVTDPRAATGAIGAPDSGPQFSVWQPGMLQPGQSSTDPTVAGNIQTIPNLYLWNTSLLAWSPDGRYLYAPLTISRRIQLPGTAAPTTNIPNELAADSGVVIPAHDTALVNLYPQLAQNDLTPLQYSEGFLPATDVAWRPDGHVLAAQPYIGSPRDVTTLTLYTCATGVIISKLTHDTQGTELFQDSTGNPVGNSLLRWSPDGVHLALIDPAFGTITLWTFNRALI